MRLQQLSDNAPELAVLVLQQRHVAGALGVETARHILDGGAQDLFEAGVANRVLRAKSVLAAAGLDGLKEGGCLGRHVAVCA